MGTVVTTETVTSNGVVLDQKVQVREAPKNMWISIKIDITI